MVSQLLTAALLVLALVGLVCLRSAARRVRIGFDVLLLAALTAELARHGVVPLVHPLPTDSGSARILVTGSLVVWWLTCARVAVAVMYFTLGHDGNARQARLFLDLLAAAIYICVGLMLIHWILDLSVRGVLATSGVVAIVLGLALQSTLADVFAGIAVGIENPFRVGDRISLAGGVEGQVVEINWRSTWIQSDGEDIVIVPNSLVSRQAIINRSAPHADRRASIDLWCPSIADAERVIEALGHATLLCPLILPAPAPAVTMTRLAPGANCYSVAFSVTDAQIKASIQSQLLRYARKQLHNAGLLSQRRVRSALNARQVLGELLLFESLDTQQIDTLAGRSVRRLVEPGEVLFSEGATDCTLYVIVCGVVELSKAGFGGHDVALGRLGAGEYVGEIGLLTGTAHAAAAKALTLCDVLQLGEDAIRPLLADNPVLAKALDKSARRGLETLQRTIAASVDRKVAEHGPLLERIRAFFSRLEGQGER